MLTFLVANGVKLKYTDNDIINIGFSLAEGKMKYDDLLAWVKSHKSLEQGTEK